MDLKFIYLDVATSTLYTNLQTYSLGQTIASTKAPIEYTSIEILLQYAADSELKTYLQRFKTEQQLRRHLRSKCNGRFDTIFDYHLSIITTFELTFERDCGRRFKPQARKRIYRALQLLPLTIDTQLEGVESVMHMSPNMRSWVTSNSGPTVKLRDAAVPASRPISLAEEVFEDVQEESLTPLTTVHQSESVHVVAVEENFVTVSIPDIRSDSVPSLTNSDSEGECVVCPRLIRRIILARQLRASLARSHHASAWSTMPIVRHARLRGFVAIRAMYYEPEWGRVSNSRPSSTMVTRLRAMVQRAYAWARRSVRRQI